MSEHGPHCVTCVCGCTCGYGGHHEPTNRNCALNAHAPTDTLSGYEVCAHGVNVTPEVRCTVCTPPSQHAPRPADEATEPTTKVGTP